MLNNANRWAGVCVAALALIFIFYVVPNHSSSSDYGWMRPRTLPMICAVCLVILGAMMIIWPQGETDLRWRVHLKSAVILVILALAVVGFSYVGFLVTAPLLITALMYMANERRILWLIIGIAGVPTIIWLVVSILLSRPLP